MMTSWQRWSATDVGNRRALNEDALVLRDADGFWAVIDGLGGADVGNVASAALQHALEHLQLDPELPQAVDQIEDILLAVHDQLREFSGSRLPARLIGCTMALLRVTDTWSLLALDMVLGECRELAAPRLAHWLAREPAVAQRELMAEALASGGNDNISLILVDIEGAHD